MERRAPQYRGTAACQWSLSHLHVKVSRISLLFTKRDLWHEQYGQVSWIDLAKMIFTAVPSLSRVSFDVVDCGEFLWRREDCEDYASYGALFIESRGKSPEMIPKSIRPLLKNGTIQHVD